MAGLKSNLDACSHRSFEPGLFEPNLFEPDFFELKLKGESSEEPSPITATGSTPDDEPFP